MGLQAKKVSMYINEGDEWQERSLYNQILMLLRREGISGATVVRALEGFTENNDPGHKLPLIIQFIDSDDAVGRVLPQLREMAPKRLITLEEVDVLP